MPAYSFFRAVGNPYFAAAGANLAEASFELGEFERAAGYAGEMLALGDRHAAPYARFTLGQSYRFPSTSIPLLYASTSLRRSSSSPRSMRPVSVSAISLRVG